MNPTKGKKRVQVVSIQLVKERNVYYESKKLNCPENSYTIFKEYIGEADREHFVVASLNTKLEVMSLHTVHIGSIDRSVVNPADIFKTAILSNARHIIVCHNHPSGHSEPSPQDVEFTRRLKDAGDILGIDVQDHIVIGDGEMTSIREWTRGAVWSDR